MKKNIAHKSFGNNKNGYQDSIFFSAPDVFEYNHWKISNKNEANILRIVKNKYAVDHFWSGKNNLMHLKTLAEGKLMNGRGKNEKEALLFGKWLYYGDGDEGIYKIGFFDKGIKDSIWYYRYEDFPIPIIKYYKNGNSIDYKGNILIDIGDCIIAEGQEVSANGVPKGTWTFYYGRDIKSEQQFLLKKDSLIVKYKNIDINTEKLIESGEFRKSVNDIIDE